MWNAELVFLVELDKRLDLLERKVRIVDRLLDTTVFGDTYIFDKVTHLIPFIDDFDWHKKENSINLKKGSIDIMEATEAMESRERRRERQRDQPTNSHPDNNKQTKSNREKPPEHPDKDSTLPIDTETVTTSTYPGDESDYSEFVREQQRNEARRLKLEKARQRSNYEDASRGNIHEKDHGNNKNNKNGGQYHDSSKIKMDDDGDDDLEDVERQHDKYDKYERHGGGKHERTQSDEIVEKRRSKHKSEHKADHKGEHRSSRERKSERDREGRRERHRSEEKLSSRHRDDRHNGEHHNSQHHQKSRDLYQIKSKSIAEKLDQLENSEEASNDYDDFTAEQSGKLMESQDTSKQHYDEKDSYQTEEDEENYANNLSNIQQQKQQQQQQQQQKLPPKPQQQPTRQQDTRQQPPPPQPPQKQQQQPAHKENVDTTVERQHDDDEDEPKSARSGKRHHSSMKEKRSLREKLKRSVHEKRHKETSESRKSDENNDHHHHHHKHREKKRTESHKERKKDKNCKKCKKHITKPEPQRAYYSDSELDCANNVSRSRSFEEHPHSERHETAAGLPPDVNAMYEAYTQKPVRSKTHTGESDFRIKDSTKTKHHHREKNESQLCDRCKKGCNSGSGSGGGGSSKSKRTRSPTEQSSIRSKLISALFQRIKVLLKETEEIRQERNDLKDKLTKLTQDYDELKKCKKAEESNSDAQEQIMKEKLETITADMRIPNKGTFREEVHQILQNIQTKYQTHWKEHEHKINQVQTDAENEIQSLMRNIVTKYVEIGEIKDRNEIVTNMLQSKNVNEPLYISTKATNAANSEPVTRQQTIGIYERYNPNTNTVQSKNELLLKVADATKPRSSVQQSLQALCRENMMKLSSQPTIYRQNNPTCDVSEKNIPTSSTSFSRDFSNQRESMIPKYLYTSNSKYQQQSATNEIVVNSMTASHKNEKLKDKFPLASLPEEMKGHFHPASSSEEVKNSFRKKLFPLQENTKPLSSVNTKTEQTFLTTKPGVEQGFLTKKDTREFWRQKLSQPTAGGDLGKDDGQKPIENKRNMN